MGRSRISSSSKTSSRGTRILHTTYTRGSFRDHSFVRRTRSTEKRFPAFLKTSLQPQTTLTLSDKTRRKANHAPVTREVPNKSAHGSISVTPQSCTRSPSHRRADRQMTHWKQLRPQECLGGHPLEMVACERNARCCSDKDVALARSLCSQTGLIITYSNIANLVFLLVSH